MQLQTKAVSLRYKINSYNNFNMETKVNLQESLEKVKELVKKEAERAIWGHDNCIVVVDDVYPFHIEVAVGLRYLYYEAFIEAYHYEEEVGGVEFANSLDIDLSLDEDYVDECKANGIEIPITEDELSDVKEELAELIENEVENFNYNK